MTVGIRGAVGLERRRRWLGGVLLAFVFWGALPMMISPPQSPGAREPAGLLLVKTIGASLCPVGDDLGAAA